MKKSEIYYNAMLAVVDSTSMSGEVKLEVLETLGFEKRIAEMVEKDEEQT